MTDKQHADDYLAFLRGYTVVLNRATPDFASEPPSYLEGVVAAARAVPDIRRYRDLSVEHEPVTTGPAAGSFTGTLADLLRSAAL